MSDTLIPLGFFAMVAYVVYVIVEAGRRRHLQATELHSRILEKAGSAQELGMLLNSEGGAKLLESLAAPRTGGATAHNRILRAVQTGLVLLSLGAGLFMISWWSPRLPDDGQAALNIFGGIAASLGVGLLLSAGASYWLSKRMGLMDGEGSRRADPVHSA
jgi:hypothetical protein